MEFAALVTEVAIENVMVQANNVDLLIDPPEFADWGRLLTLLREAFADVIGRIDPPSTVYDLTTDQLRDKASKHSLLLAVDGNDPVACLYLRSAGKALFVERFAIRRTHRGSGLARRMIERANLEAQYRGHAFLALETRVALIENQSKFASFGFEIVGGRTHPGHAETTTYRMQRRVQISLMQSVSCEDRL